MSNSDDKTLRTNSLGTDPLQRLASFKTPRDLSLGGVKPNKKVFTPNLNVTRHKNKGPTLTSRDQKKDDKGRKDRKNDKSKNLKNGPKVIKSSGVFSEGLGATERHSSRISFGREADVTPTLQRPTIRVKDVIKIDKELEEERIRSIVGENDNVDDESSEQYKYIPEKDAPIKLPMDLGGWSNKQQKPVYTQQNLVKLKEEVVVKKEPKEEVDSATPTVDIKPLVDIKEEMYENMDIINMMMTDKPTLILLQLPDTLPGRGSSADYDVPRRKANEPSTSTGEVADEKPDDNRCRLSDLKEGRIGKLLVHRSGRISVALGDTKFDACPGTRAAFHQEVVSLATDDKSRSANMIALGPVQHKLNLVPDWESLFYNMSM